MAAAAAFVSAESVLGVMVAAELGAPEVLLTMAARKAAVLGEGGGNDMPPPRGVRPVLKLDKSGVKPVRNELGSKWELCGPASMAGDKGPDLNELVRPADHGYALVSPAGEVMEATGGSRGLGVDADS